jgi:predicted dinucleotide-binding enzyme
LSICSQAGAGIQTTERRNFELPLSPSAVNALRQPLTFYHAETQGHVIRQRALVTGGYTMKIKKIGIVGSGNIGGTLGILLGKAGFEIFYSSRHPDTLKDLVESTGPQARAGNVAEAIAFGDVIILSLPMKAFTELDANTKQALKGKIVIDTSNPYPERDGAIAEEALREPGGTGPFVARLLPGARVIRAFNTVYFKDLKKTSNKDGETIGIPIAGDDQEGLQAAVELTERAGLTVCRINRL